MTREEANIWIENTFSDFTEKEDRQESIFYLIKRIFDDKEKKEETEIKDSLAELEKVILDYYLDKGYQIGVGGWGFKVNISTYFKDKEIQVMFKPNYSVNHETVFRISKDTTKEMFDKAIEYFSTKG